MVSYNPVECLFLTVFLLGIYFPTNYAQLDNTMQPEVTITQGTLLGTILTTRNGRNISAFMGIPFAQPPTGDLRFANPVPADGWNETLNATANTKKCPQIRERVLVGEEDCLYLNVYTPQLPQNTNSSLLPVMVYVHGGAFKTSPDSIGPELLLDADVLLVNMKYRLGPLGFLSTGDSVASGNWGLKDQVLALKWVQDNIRNFGGDPRQVTIFGESAGSGCVHLLTLSNATIGLFHRYITQSGSALTSWAHRPRAAYSSRAFQLGKYVGCFNDTSDSLITCLRTIDFSDIVATISQFAAFEIMTWGPTDEPDIEGALLTDSPSDLLAGGKIRDLPWMTGVVRDEGILFTAAFYADEEKLDHFLENFDTSLPTSLFWKYKSDSGAAWVNATKSYYFNDDLTSNKTALLENLTILTSDAYFFYPVYKALHQQHVLAVNPQYFYTFNYRGTYSYSYISSGSTVNCGVSHADDLIYLFPPDPQFSYLNETMSETDYKMVDIMVQLWTSFVINGTPTASTSSGTIKWEPYSTEENYLRIGNESDVALEVQYSFYKERMQFWAALDAATDTQDDSGTVTSTPNSLFLLLIACLKFVLTTATADRLG